MYTLKKIIKLSDDISDGVKYIVEAFDDSGDVVIVKMTEEEIEQGGADE